MWAISIQNVNFKCLHLLKQRYMWCCAKILFPLKLLYILTCYNHNLQCGFFEIFFFWPIYIKSNIIMEGKRYMSLQGQYSCIIIVSVIGSQCLTYRYKSHRLNCAVFDIWNFWEERARGLAMWYFPYHVAEMVMHSSISVSVAWSVFFFFFFAWCWKGVLCLAITAKLRVNIYMNASLHGFQKLHLKKITMGGISAHLLDFIICRTTLCCNYTADLLGHPCLKLCTWRKLNVCKFFSTKWNKHL